VALCQQVPYSADTCGTEGIEYWVPVTFVDHGGYGDTLNGFPIGGVEDMHAV
jgi:hypothetical protein